MIGKCVTKTELSYYVLTGDLEQDRAAMPERVFLWHTTKDGNDIIAMEYPDYRNSGQMVVALVEPGMYVVWGEENRVFKIGAYQKETFDILFSVVEEESV